MPVIEQRITLKTFTNTSERKRSLSLALILVNKHFVTLLTRFPTPIHRTFVSRRQRTKLITIITATTMICSKRKLNVIMAAVLQFDAISNAIDALRMHCARFMSKSNNKMRATTKLFQLTHKFQFHLTFQ